MTHTNAVLLAPAMNNNTKAEAYAETPSIAVEKATPPIETLPQLEPSASAHPPHPLGANDIPCDPPQPGSFVAVQPVNTKAPAATIAIISPTAHIPRHGPNKRSVSRNPADA